MIQEWIEIKICPKCGKANNVTRKFCAGCGASLIRKMEDDEPAAVEEVEKTPFAEIRSVPEEDKFVRPSEVASEQAKMEVSEPQPYRVAEEPSLPREEVKAPPSREMEMERGREVVQDILEKVRAAEARSRGEEVTPEPEMEVEAPPEEIIEEVEAPIAYEEPIVEPEVEEEYEEEEYEEEEYEEEEVEEEEVEEVEPPPPMEEVIEEPIPKVQPAVSMAVEEPVMDEKVREFESEIKTFSIELEQLQTELNQLHSRLDEEVERYLVVAETKRTRTESLERELSLAKKEYSDANKEYKNAENRRKKELSNAEKRIQDVEKRIRKAKEGKEKRIRDLEKERLKREEEARK